MSDTAGNLLFQNTDDEQHRQYIFNALSKSYHVRYKE